MPDMEINGAISLGFRDRLSLLTLDKSRFKYYLPFPGRTLVTNIEITGPSHVGKYKGAIDFCVPLGTPVLAPFPGRIIEVVDNHERYGNSPEYIGELNYITIEHVVEDEERIVEGREETTRTFIKGFTEYSQLAHLAKGSARVKVGDFVRAGYQIGITGLSGWMTEPHLHFFVFRDDSKKVDFVGLKINFSQSVINLSKNK